MESKYKVLNKCMKNIVQKIFKTEEIKNSIGELDSAWKALKKRPKIPFRRLQIQSIPLFNSKIKIRKLFITKPSAVSVSSSINNFLNFGRYEEIILDITVIAVISL